RLSLPAAIPAIEKGAAASAGAGSAAHTSTYALFMAAAGLPLRNRATGGWRPPCSRAASRPPAALLRPAGSGAARAAARAAAAPVPRPEAGHAAAPFPTLPGADPKMWLPVDPARPPRRMLAQSDP